MKAILEFDLPKEEANFIVAAKGRQWAMVVWLIMTRLDNAIANNEKVKLEDLREEFNSYIRSQSVELGEDLK